ncbi:MlaE family ABC transporter permease [Vampirovibrio sp.]|uniref:MlaE family ABC transporter permease n=1 Tax=Vampirovibrio sp. TaxID=2717857 RepID=UPI00359363F1
MSFTQWTPKRLTHFLDEAGCLFINVWDSFVFLAKGRTDWQKTIVQTALVGFDSLGMSVLICVITGSVLALQTASKFAQTGTDSYVGGLVALAIVRELGPIFTCLSVGARAGTAIAAEIANMKVTNQVDALRVMGINPIRYLFLPRMLACMIALPMLTIIGEVTAILGGMFVADWVSGLHYHMYLESVWLFVKPYDIRVSLFKAVIFGMILAAISCTVGLNAKGGAREVGLSTTKAVVWIAVTIMITDFFLTWIFFGTSYD